MEWERGKEEETFGTIERAQLYDTYKFEYTILLWVSNMPNKILKMRVWLSDQEAYKYEPESLDWEEHTEYAQIIDIEEYRLLLPASNIDYEMRYGPIKKLKVIGYYRHVFELLINDEIVVRTGGDAAFIYNYNPFSHDWNHHNILSVEAHQ